jgi:DNA repair protein RecO (recombination protein O)
LPLPGVMRGVPGDDPAEVVLGLQTTGHFLSVHMAQALGNKPLPAARQRLVDLIAARAPQPERG